MKNCGEIIEKALNQKRVKRKDFCEFLQMTPQNLSKILRKPSIDAELLENCCRYLELNPADFFDFRLGEQSGGTKIGSIDQRVLVGDASVNFRDAEQMLMDKLIAEKDARIQTLQSTVDLLQNMLSQFSGANHAASMKHPTASPTREQHPMVPPASPSESPDK